MFNFAQIMIFCALVLLVGGIVGLIIAAVAGSKSKVDSGEESYFDGGTVQLILWRLLTSFLTMITLGIAYPWTVCMLKRWEVKHTVINGKRLKFTGNGAQIFGKYILWAVLSVITFGIYSIWLGLGMKKWVTKHTVYQNDNSGLKSHFTGGAGGWFVNNVLIALTAIFTLGIATPWATVHFMKWEAEHSVINGSPLVFKGTGGQLFVKDLLLAVLTPLTLGIYSIFYPVSILKWQYSNTDALYKTNKIQKLARAHQESANVDFAKFKIAANDTELNILKSGIKGTETVDELKAFADGGNPYAMYMYAKATDNNIELIKAAAGYNYHFALFDYAQTFKNVDEASYINYLELSARNGNTEAAWVLRNVYYEKARTNSIAVATEFLQKSLYWFKVAINQEHPEAISQAVQYENDVEKLALWIASMQKGRGVGAGAIIGLAVGLGAIVLGAVVVVLLFFPKAGIFRGFGSHAERTDSNVYYPLSPEGNTQRGFYVARTNTDNDAIWNLDEYNGGTKVREYLDENYSQQENDIRIKHFSLVPTNETDNSVRYGINMNVTGISESKTDVIVYHNNEVIKVEDFSYEGIIEGGKLQELLVIVIADDSSNRYFDVNFEYKYLEKMNKLPEENNQPNTPEEEKQPEKIEELTTAKAKELIEMQNDSHLLYHFKALGMLDESKTYQLATFDGMYETCYAVKGINTVDDLKEYLCKYYTEAYAQYEIDNKAGHWRIENDVIYFEPNYGMGSNIMFTDGATIESLGNNSYTVTAETEWSGLRTLYVTYENGDYKIDLFIGPEFTKADGWNLVYNLYEMEHRTLNYFENKEMINKSKSFERTVSFLGDGKMKLTAYALNEIDNAEELRKYIYNFCTPDYHLSKHGNPSIDAQTAESFMDMWFTEEGTLYVSEQYDYPWIIKEETLDLKRTDDGYLITVKEFAAGDPNGNPEKELKYSVVYENGKYLVDMWGSSIL